MKKPFTLCETGLCLKSLDSRKLGLKGNPNLLFTLTPYIISIMICVNTIVTVPRIHLDRHNVNEKSLVAIVYNIFGTLQASIILRGKLLSF